MAVTYSYKGILGSKYTEGKVVAINKDMSWDALSNELKHSKLSKISSAPAEMA